MAIRVVTLLLLLLFTLTSGVKRFAGQACKKNECVPKSDTIQGCVCGDISKQNSVGKCNAKCMSVVEAEAIVAKVKKQKASKTKKVAKKTAKKVTKGLAKEMIKTVTSKKVQKEVANKAIKKVTKKKDKGSNKPGSKFKLASLTNFASKAKKLLKKKGKGDKKELKKKGMSKKKGLKKRNSKKEIAKAKANAGYFGDDFYDDEYEFDDIESDYDNDYDAEYDAEYDDEYDGEYDAEYDDEYDDDEYQYDNYNNEYDDQDIDTLYYEAVNSLLRAKDNFDLAQQIKQNSDVKKQRNGYYYYN